MASTKQDTNQGKQATEGAKKADRTSMRGFASMDPNQQRAIASAGGRAAHRSGNAHEFTSEEARRAGSMSHKNSSRKNSGNQGSASAGNQGGSSRGGSSEQHAEAGRQSHKNEK